MENILSGIKPTGRLTLGNYIGAIRNFAKIQYEGNTFIFIADLHALTLPISPTELYNNTKSIVAYYLSAGLDPKHTKIFLQSSVKEHSEMDVLLQNFAYMGEMSRMTQFKDYSSKAKDDHIGLGIFTYPALMAGDILLYDAKRVPVGHDQKQHVELTRVIAKRINNKYGKIFVVPEPETVKVGAKIMSLSDPTKKMSKSDPKGDIFLDDSIEVMKKKIMSAVTDMDSKVYYDKENKPGISNLMTIYSCFTNKTFEEIEEEFLNKGYGEFKKAVANALENEMVPFKNKYNEIINSDLINQVLIEGAQCASKIASNTLERFKKALGLYNIYE